jgi:hypothetical protein
MKKKTMTTVFGFAISLLSVAQSSPETAIKKVITAFAKAGDENKADELSVLLDDQYRLVMNRLFGSTTVSVLTKTDYVEKIRTKVFGGDARQVTIDNVVISGASASAKVTLACAKMTVVALMQLIADAAGHWKIVSDIPTVVK